jgi:hypothetical protein
VSVFAPGLEAEQLAWIRSLAMSNMRHYRDKAAAIERQQAEARRALAHERDRSVVRVAALVVKQNCKAKAAAYFERIAWELSR